MGNTPTTKHHGCPITLSQLKYLPKKWNVSLWKQTTVVNYTFLSFCGLIPRVNSFCPEYANSIRDLTNVYAPDLQKGIWNFAASSLCSKNKYIHLIMQSETLWLLYFWSYFPKPRVYKTSNQAGKQPKICITNSPDNLLIQMVGLLDCWTHGNFISLIR